MTLTASFQGHESENRAWRLNGCSMGHGVYCLLAKMFTIAHLVKVRHDLWPWMTFRGHLKVTKRAVHPSNSWASCLLFAHVCSTLMLWRHSWMHRFFIEVTVESSWKRLVYSSQSPAASISYSVWGGQICNLQLPNFLWVMYAKNIKIGQFLSCYGNIAKRVR